MAEESLLRISQVAQILCVSKQTLRNWDAKGILKAVRYGVRRDRKYRNSDIALFIKKGGL